MGTLTFDLRDALKSLRREPGYGAAVALTLAVTIGATTAVFSIVNGVLLRPLAYREPDRLLAIQEIVPELRHLYPSLSANPRHYAVWRARASSFEQIAEYQIVPLTLTNAGDPAQLDVVVTTGNLFDVIGFGVARGRTLRVDDERMNGDPVVVITDQLWRQRFNADAAVVGRPAVLDGTPRTIVGVLGPELRFPHGSGLDALARSARPPDAFVPLRINPERFSANGEYNYSVLGRLRRGVPVERALAELNVLQADIAATMIKRPGLQARVVPLMTVVVGDARRGLLLLLGAIAAVLLIACANLANLSLTRTLSHARDAAIRAALGASRSRLVRRVVVEQTALALIGGALGLAVAQAALVIFVKTAPIDLPRVDEVALDVRVIAFAAAVSVFAGLLVAMVPAWRLAGGDVQHTLRAAGPGTTAERGGLRARAALLTTQVALSVTLLVVTMLLAVSFVHVMNVPRGFVSDRVLVMSVALPGARYADAKPRVTAYDRILDEVRAVPGVARAAWSSVLPLTGQTWVDALEPEDRPDAPRDARVANYRFVGADYFAALSIPIRRGRALTPADFEGARTTMAAVISERAAAQLWQGVDPIGRRFHRGDPDEKAFEIVGVAGDVRTSIESVPPLMVYVPYVYRSRTRASLIVQAAASTPPETLTNPVRQAVWRIEREAAIADVRPMEALVDSAVGGRRYQTSLFVAFGGVALFIAVLGVYAATAYGISRRRREMNIRVALGARPAQVRALVVRQGFSPVAVGLGAGIAGALAISSLVASLLYDVRARDPRILAVVVAAVGAIGLLACIVAAKQGLRLNPASALRDE